MSTATYTATSNDWALFSENTRILLHNDLQAVVYMTEQPFLKKDIFDLGETEEYSSIGQSTTSYSSLRQRTFDEVMEEVLEDRAEAWERLADL